MRWKERQEKDLIGKRFGEEDHLEIVEVLDKIKGVKREILFKCHICCKDQELNGDGLFKGTLCNIRKGCLPCSCSKSPKWSEDQFKVLSKRLAEKKGVVFLGWAGEFQGSITKLHLSCPRHGDWKTTSFNGFSSKEGAGCPDCLKENPNSRMADEKMISLFMSTNSFHPDTKFWRSDRMDTQGCKIYWYSFCPVCNDTFESAGSSLRRGSLPCKCSEQKNQNYFYIHLIKDNFVPVAVKFGISSNVFRRFLTLKSSCLLDLHLLKSWYFEDSMLCRKAETEVKNSVACGVLNKMEIKEGWTETTYVGSIDTIIEIIVKYGGTEVETKES